MTKRTHTKAGKFKKGHKGLKPKGAKSKKLKDLEEAQKFLGNLMYVDNPEKAKEDWEALGPSTRFRYRAAFGEFYWPKLARNENINPPAPPLTVNITNLSTLTDEELNKVLKERLEKK